MLRHGGAESELNIGMDFGNKDDTFYNERIYVGYRYYDKNNVKPIFPFGYGLGYTRFSHEISQFRQEGTKGSIKGRITNVGDYPGKETVQVYVSFPEGKLEQADKILTGFFRTEELKPLETEVYEIEFDLKDFACFDSEGSSRILEAGRYAVYTGKSSRDLCLCGHMVLASETVTEELHHIGQSKGEIDEKIRRTDISNQMTNELADFSDRELAYLCVGGFREEGSKSVIGNAGIKVVGAAGETTEMLTDRGIASITMADGPAGLRLSPLYGKEGEEVYPLDDALPAAIEEFADEEMLAALRQKKKAAPERKGEVCEQYCTALPIGTALACSWNLQVLELCGDIVGSEMERFGIQLWLAPALNIQRSPLCGRNFEYYSEDPFISGKMAAAVVRGVQRHKNCGAVLKHFCCNNQETNRFHSNSIVGERALRDIYLKGFEIAVKESRPAAIMTSYNLLNGEHTSQRADLLKIVLRNEWGYEGLVMSDWLIPGFGIENKYPYACASGSIKAGNDLMMPGGMWDIEDLLRALEDETEYSITRMDLLECAASVLRTVKFLNQ